MHPIRHICPMSSLIGCLLILMLLTSCNSNMTTVVQGTPTIAPPYHRIINPPDVTITRPVPPTETSCPQSGSARAMITAPLATGSHQLIIYSLNQGTYDQPTSGTLMRYDVTTKEKTELFTIANAHIYQAQISADGQWILFVTATGSIERTTRLQMLRIDGQGLQTLYCASGYGIQQTIWSANQHHLLFYNVVNQRGVIYLLDMQTGKLQIELTTPLNVRLVLRSWLDESRIYLSDSAVDTIHARIYLLDITKGAQQNLDSLTTVLLREYGDFDSSYDGSQLLVSYGGCRQGSCNGPSSIGVQSINGGKQRTVFNSSVYDVIAVRVIDQHSLFFIIGNTLSFSDTSHNGLWKVNMDGSGLTRLIPISEVQYGYFNYRTQDLWSNVSRDQSMYVIQINTVDSLGETQSLYLGAFSEGAPGVFASATGGDEIGMVGWTKM